MLLILSAGTIFWFSGNRRDNNVSQSVPKIIGKVVLTIDFGNGEKRAFEGDVVENETLLDALILTSKAGNFRYNLDERSNLAAIESFVKNSKKSWYWYLNGKKNSKSLNEIFLKADDNILIKYE